MDPRIRYCKTSDGVSIAYCVMGEGRPLVVVSPIWLSQLDKRWDLLGYAPVLEGWAKSRTVVRYDGRGIGLSQRENLDFSLEARIEDLKSVTELVGDGPLELYAGHHAGFAALGFAARFPERVSHLILRDCFARGSEYYRISPVVRMAGSLESMVEEQWEFFTLAISNRSLGFSDPEAAQGLAELWRASLTPVAFLTFREATRKIDVTDLLPLVRASTLVMHGRTEVVPLSLPQQIAAAIPGAQFVPIELPPIGASDEEVRLIESFLGIESAPGAMAAPPAEPSPVRTILFTDVEGSTALTDRLGDAAGREVLREHERITREALKAHGGSEVKTMGDGFMASFTSATKALECAIAIQKAFEPRDNATVGAPLGDGGGVGSAAPRGGAGRGEGISVRIGLNAGEPIAEDDPAGRGDLFGTAVNLAARVASQAQGGEILVSDVVRQLVAGKGFLFNDRGEHALKGFEDPVRVWEVRWSEDAL